VSDNPSINFKMPVIVAPTEAISLNIEYLLCDAAGEIVGWGSCHKDDLAAHAGPGRYVLAAPMATDRLAKIIDVSGLPDLTTLRVIQRPPDRVAAIQASRAWAAYQDTARAALAKSDLTVMRCTENSIVVPIAWATYRSALRAILGAPSGDPNQPLPVRPDYPAGT